MATKSFRLVGMFILVALFSCNVKKNIVGKYHHEELGLNYTLELRADNTFIQTLIDANDTFINKGEYSISLNIINISPWRNRQELIDGGGCFGCELKYKHGKLYFYTDPDDLPEDVFLKMNK